MIFITIDLLKKIPIEKLHYYKFNQYLICYLFFCSVRYLNERGQARGDLYDSIKEWSHVNCQTLAYCLSIKTI